ncbi:prephenate dehydratase domain-containing protein [Methylophaga sp.]|uniref:prephenate dehydratase domain-containing protein n=1 Tax=Methylophaga sp. TaxID=2024840 RepID=UPI003A8F4CCA
MDNSLISSLRTIHTLGPVGTNCQLAAREWFQKNQIDDGTVRLYDTLEEAVLNVKTGEALLACVVYPKLHNLVFENLGEMEFKETFITNTYDMVLAGKDKQIRSIVNIASHPAPVDLVRKYNFTITHVSSNSAAAIEVAKGNFDGCITTIEAAKQQGLYILENFGPVPMGFSIHTMKGD